jgi:fructokinase
MNKVYSVGETTYDIIFRNGQPTGAIVGGSVLNTSVSLGRLGIPVSFISRMGNDQIGDLSLTFLNENGVNCDYVTRFEGNSRLAMAFLDSDNNADYQFYKAAKTPSLRFPELEKSDRIIFGSTNAVRDEGRNSLLLFLNQAHDKNILTIYDPNIREFGAFELIEVRRKFEENLHLTKVLKESNQDFKRLYETTNPDEIFAKVTCFGVEVLIMTNGSDPIQLRTKTISMDIPVQAVETTSTIGAGDNFSAGIIFGFIKEEVETRSLLAVDELKWKTILDHANSFAV